MNEVKRWNPGLNGSAFIGMLEMARWTNTDYLYVLASDYDSLAAECERLRADRMTTCKFPGYCKRCRAEGNK